MPLLRTRWWAFALFCSLIVPAAGFGSVSVSGIVPAAAPHGARVLLVGHGLDQPDLVPSFTTTVGFAAAEVVLRTPTYIEAIVPPSAITGPVRVGGATGLVATLAFTLAADPPFITVATVAASDPTHDVFKQPAGVSIVPPADVIYIADRLHHQIRSVHAGQAALVAGSGSPGLRDGSGADAQFAFPAAVAADTARNVVYIADSGNHVIRKLTTAGLVTTFAGSGRPEDADGIGVQAGLNTPSALCVDSSGMVYVADSGNSKIKRIAPDGTVQTIAGGSHAGFGDGPALQSLFNHPEGIAVTPDGTIYVGDTKNNVIRKIAGGVTATLAGTGHGGWVDGPAAAAEFKEPVGLAADDGGNLYVSDRLNHTLRRISASGEVTTVAGTGNPGFSSGAPAASSFKQPSGVAWAGVVLVADTLNDALRAIYPQVSVTAVYPRAGQLSGGNTIRILGSGFVPSTQVTIGGISAAVTYTASTELQVVVPPGTAGTADVGVTTNAGTSILPGAYAYVPPPTIDSIQPNRGKLVGGDSVTIHGTGFVDDEQTSVTIGGSAARGLIVTSSTLLQFDTPPAAAGPADVVVTTVGGTATREGGFVYVPPPTVSSVQPAKGKTAGGEAITIVGANFDDLTSGVTIGGAPTTPTFINSTTLTATTPPGVAGPADVVVTTAGGTGTLPAAFRYFAVPSISGFAPAQGGPGTLVTVSGANFDPDPAGNAVEINSLAAVVTSASATQLVIVVPAGVSSGPIALTTAGGRAVSAQVFVAATAVTLAVSPEKLTLAAGMEQQFTATATYGDGSIRDVTPSAVWTSSNPAVVSVDSPGRATARAPGSAMVSASFLGATARAQVTVGALEPVPSDPATTAPPLNGTTPTSVADATVFLYTGPNPVQTGVAAGTIDGRRAAVVRGRVLQRDGSALPGATVEIAGHPEFGSTLSRADGMFDLVINGGGPFYVHYEKNGFIAADRRVEVPWQDFAIAPDVVLVGYDAAVSTIQMSSPITQVARGSVSTDADGSRRATLIIPAGSGASMTLPNGTVQSLPALHLRATEYSVGETGDTAMPALLPPQSGYTYCVELSADEAVAAGAHSVTFSAPLAFYVENFLKFPVGSVVPAGYYDRQQMIWVPSPNGRVVKIIAVTGGAADLDMNGDGQADDAAALTAAGVTDAERQQLAVLYVAGQTLWRVPMTHLTPWDYNWPYAPPFGATAPGQPSPTIKQQMKNGSKKCGSIVGCEDQTLGESLGIAGTPFSLRYGSDRTPGFKASREMTIYLTDSTLPPGIKGVALEVNVAGQHYQGSFAAAPNMVTKFAWNGSNVYGQAVQGGQDGLVRIGYTYQAVYAQGAQFGEAFAAVGNVPISADRTRKDITLWQEHKVPIESWNAAQVGLGGWTIDVHHVYDSIHKRVFLGNGEIQRAENVGATVSTIAGRADCFGSCSGFSGDGGPAVNSTLYYPDGILVAPDGSIYIADTFNSRIRKIDPAGIIRTIAGTGSNAGTRDDVPALQADIFPQEIAFGPDGSIYFAEQLGGDVDLNRVRRIWPDGIITTVAGGKLPGFSGDGDLAINARLQYPGGIAVASDGTIYISDRGNRRVRRVSSSGIITTFVGTGEYSSTGDGGPASAATIRDPWGIDVGPDGSVYIVDQGSGLVRKVSPNGIISTVAGNPNASDLDGVPATQSRIAAKTVKAGRDGSIYLGGSGRVRRVGPDGIITTIVGRKPGGCCPPKGDGDLATNAIFSGIASFAFGPDGDLYVDDTDAANIRRIKSPLPGYSFTDVVIPSEDGRELFVFDSEGRHTATKDAITGAQRFTFGYDTAGNLTGVTDAFGATMTIERSAQGLPTAIVAPGGQRTTLTCDGAGRLASISNGASEGVVLMYGADGLLTSLRDPRGKLHSFSYDDVGQLTGESDSAGASAGFVRTGSDDRPSIQLTTAGGRVTTFDVLLSSSAASTHMITDGNGLRRTLSVAAGGMSSTETLPSGMSISIDRSPDPRWGLLAPFTSNITIRTPQYNTTTITATKTAELTNPKDPQSLKKLTETQTVNGRTYQRVFDAASRTLTSTSPVGRQQISVFDAYRRIVSNTVPGFAPVTYSYNPRGLIDGLTAGSRATVYTYDTAGNLASARDSLGRTTSFTYDAVGRLLQQTLADNRVVGYTYDANGNVTSVTPPGRPQHRFTLTAGDRRESYTPPGGSATRYLYDADNVLTEVRRPDGTALSFSYDQGGRLATLTAPTGAITFSYASSGMPSSISTNDGSVAFDMDGPMLRGTTWSGGTSGSVRFIYDRNFRVTSDFINGTNFISYTFDNDGFLTNAGAMTVARDAQNGRVSGTTLGTVSDSLTYNFYGELTAYSATQNGSPLFSLQLTRDAGGRVTSWAESLFGSTVTTDYVYDGAGRLSTVSSGGVPVASYDYDSNGNRTRKVSAGQPEIGEYMDDDRLSSYAGATYSYNAAGDLASRTDAAGTTTYAYDALGNLRSVVLPDGRRIDYVIDALNRRVGKKIDGVRVASWLYADHRHILAELDGSGAVRSRFVYASKANVPDYMIRGGVTYRIISDPIGSPRLVLNAALGTTAQMIGYDEFGRVLSDSSPGFQPFGFGGGLYDADTGLVRFGVRDYDARTGRWTTRDPIGFAGGMTNLYGYSLNDPINAIDPDGTLTIPFVGWVDVGENAGQAALESYADTLADPNSSLVERSGAIVGGVFAALWTPCTSDKTFTTLAAAYTVNGWVGRPFYQYYPGNNPAYSSRYLTRGWGWDPPYTVGTEAAEKLALPPWNTGGAVREVPNSWRFFAGGPGPVGPNYGHLGGGTEYLVGGWP